MSMTFVESVLCLFSVFLIIKLYHLFIRQTLLVFYNDKSNTTITVKLRRIIIPDFIPDRLISHRRTKNIIIRTL